MNNKTQSYKSINHPGRNQLLQYFDYHCAAATPPSKGGESSVVSSGQSLPGHARENPKD